MAFYSSGVEYGIHCLVNMIDEEGKSRVMTVREAAKLQGVPYDYLGKIFTKLSKAGLVEGYEGRKGGFKLAKNPADIKFLDITRAIDGEKNIFECKEIRQRMGVFTNDIPSWACQDLCGIHNVMRKAQEQMENELAHCSILDIVKQINNKSNDTFQIDVQEWLKKERL